MAAAFLLLAAPAVVAHDDRVCDDGSPPGECRRETKADCEDGQKSISYDDRVHDTFTRTPAYACEGEHWDGQDPLASDDPGDEQPCMRQDDPETDEIELGYCQGANPNDLDAKALELKPVTARSTSLVGANSAETYLALNIDPVGHAVVYVGVCRAGGQLEGGTCHTSEGRSGVYLRDNTPENVLATAVSAAGLTKGSVSEGDCDQKTYKQGVDENDRNKCKRDNTAVTAGAKPLPLIP